MRFSILLACALAVGCVSVVEKTITTTGRVASTTITTAAGVGKTVVKTTVSGAIDIVGSAVKESAVTLIETGTGISKKLPLTEGMNVYTAGTMGKINLAKQAIELVRMSEKTFFKAGELTPKNPGPVLKVGDIIRISPAN